MRFLSGILAGASERGKTLSATKNSRPISARDNYLVSAILRVSRGVSLQLFRGQKVSGLARQQRLLLRLRSGINLPFGCELLFQILASAEILGLGRDG